MDRSVILDTDVMLDYLRGRSEAIQLIRNAVRVGVSAVTVAELYAGVRGESESRAVRRFMDVLELVAVTTEVAQAAGRLKQRYFRSHGTGLADAIIAATV